MKTTSLSTARAASVALLLLALPARLAAENLPLTPTLDAGASLSGQSHSRISWPAVPGVRYRVRKSGSLGQETWTTRALVEATSTTATWVDPEPPGSRAFYEVPAPVAEVFSVQPTVLSAAGGMLTLYGQCLPAGSELVFEIEGQPPLVLPLMPGEPGSYRALVPAGAVVPGASILSAAVRDQNRVVILDIKENFTESVTGRADDTPPPLPPLLSGWVETVWNKQCVEKDTSVRLADQDCDRSAGYGRKTGGDGNPYTFTSLSCKTSEAKNTLGSIARQGTGLSAGKASFSDLSMMRGGGSNPSLMMDSPGEFVVTSHGSTSGSDSILLTLSGTCDMQRPSGGGYRIVNDGGGKRADVLMRSGLPGEVCIQETDLSLATPAGPPLEWTRTYRSRPRESSPSAQGNNCDFSWNVRIEPIPPAAGVNATRLYLYSGDGRRDVMVRQADGTYTCDGMFRSGRFNGDTSFTLTFADRSAMIFCPLVGAPWQGRIGSLVDRNGVAVTCTYTAGGLLNTVTSQFGQSFTCTYSGGLLTRVTDHTGRYVAYTYYDLASEGPGSPGDLQTASCPQLPGQPPLAGPKTYTYTIGHADAARNHNLLSITDGAGRALVRCTYSITSDPAVLEYDTVASVDHWRDPAHLSGNVTLIKLVPAPPVIGSPVVYRSIINDSEGRVTECDHDAHHRTVAVRQFTGYATPGVPVTDTTNRPDPAMKRRAGDPAFYETSFRYNSDHCVTRITHPDGTQERFIYGREWVQNCPVRERGNEHSITIRTAGGEERTVSCDFEPGLGTNERVCFAPANNDRAWIDTLYNLAGGGGSVWDGGEDGGGCTDDAGDTRTYTGGRFALDIDGCDATLARGGKITKSRSNIQNNRTGSTAQGIMGQKAKAWMVNNFEVHPVFGGKKGYDYFKHRGSSFCTRLVTSHGQVFTWSHDTHGNLIASRTPIAGAGCDVTYNSIGQCTSVTVLNGPGSSYRTDITFDPLTSWPTGCIVDPDVNGTGAGLHITTSCERDNLGRITRRVNPLGHDWLTSYNALGQVTREQSPAVGTVAATASRIACDYFYDAGGLLARWDVELRAATGVLDAANPAYSSFIVYDSRCQVVRVAREQRPVFVPTTPPLLDPAPLGLENFAVTDFTYNDAGECVSVSTPALSRGQATDRVCLTYYDERGLEWQCQDGLTGAPGTTTVQYDYTPAGQEARRMLLLSGLVGDGQPFPEELYTYDGFQRLSSITDPMGNVTTYEYGEHGIVTCSVYGEESDVPGSAMNVLLAKSSFPLDALVLRPGDTREAALRFTASGKFRPAFFDIFVADDVCTSQRFTPGAPAPHPVETTIVERSPAGLVMSVSCNNDTLLTRTYDTAARSLASSDGFVVHGTVRDQAGNVVLDSRMDLTASAGTPTKVYSWASIFDALGRRISTTDGGGNTVSGDYDSISRPTICIEPRGVVHHFSYDGEIPGGVGAPPAPFSCLHECDVDNDGDLEILGHFRSMDGMYYSSTNSHGYTTTCVRDSAGNLTQCNFPDGTHETYGFDNYGRQNSITHKDGTIVAADFNLDGYPDVVTWSGGPPGAVPVQPTTYTYNGLGHVTQCNQGDSHLVMTYDSLGNQLSEHHNGHGVTRTFNHLGRTGVTYDNGTRFVETRNAAGLVTSVSAVSSTGTLTPVSTVEHAGHRVAIELRANGVSTVHTYRADNDAPLPGGTEDFSFDQCVRTVCTNAAGTVLYSTRIRRDHAQNVTQSDHFFTGVAQSTGRRHVQGFNRLGHLTQSIIQRREVTGGPFNLESLVTYALDHEGRRLSESDGITLGLYEQNPLLPFPGDHQMGQYSSWPGGPGGSSSPLLWDDAGCLTSMSSSAGARQFIYDVASRLVAVNDPNTGQPIATYAYSADGRRARSTIASSDPLVAPVSTFFVYDGWDCIMELGDDGLPNLSMATSAGIAICVISRNGTLVYPHGGGPKETSNGVAVPKFLDYMKKGKRSEAELNLNRPFFTGPSGTVTERTDCDHAGKPVFLTSDGVLRQGATGTIIGYDWFYTRKGYTVNARSDTPLYCDRYCPETGFMQGHGSVYSPQIGTDVSTPKEKPGGGNPLGLSATRGIAVDCRRP